MDSEITVKYNLIWFICVKMRKKLFSSLLGDSERREKLRCNIIGVSYEG